MGLTRTPSYVHIPMAVTRQDIRAGHRPLSLVRAGNNAAPTQWRGGRARDRGPFSFGATGKKTDSRGNSNMVNVWVIVAGSA